MSDFELTKKLIWIMFAAFLIGAGIGIGEGLREVKMSSRDHPVSFKQGLPVPMRGGAYDQYHVTVGDGKE